jgi:hypothetical protein
MRLVGLQLRSIFPSQRNAADKTLPEKNLRFEKRTNCMFRCSMTVESVRICAMNQTSCHNGLGELDVSSVCYATHLICGTMFKKRGVWLVHSTTTVSRFSPGSVLNLKIHTPTPTYTPENADNLSDETQSGRADGLPLASSSLSSFFFSPSSSPSLEPTLQSLYCNIHSLLSTSSSPPSLITLFLLGSSS